MHFSMLRRSLTQITELSHKRKETQHSPQSTSTIYQSKSRDAPPAVHLGLMRRPRRVRHHARSPMQTPGRPGWSPRRAARRRASGPRGARCRAAAHAAGRAAVTSSCVSWRSVSRSSGGRAGRRAADAAQRIDDADDVEARVGALRHPLERRDGARVVEEVGRKLEAEARSEQPAPSEVRRIAASVAATSPPPPPPRHHRRRHRHASDATGATAAAAAAAVAVAEDEIATRRRRAPTREPRAAPLSQARPRAAASARRRGRRRRARRA